MNYGFLRPVKARTSIPNFPPTHLSEIMTELEMVTRFAAAVAEHLRPPIPLTIDLWDIATIAAYLKREPQVVRERMACVPDFPKAIRLPTKTGKSQPLYRAVEVIKWVATHQEKQ